MAVKAFSQLDLNTGLFFHFFYNISKRCLVEYKRLFFFSENCGRILYVSGLQLSVFEFCFFIGLQNYSAVVCGYLDFSCLYKDSCLLYFFCINQK